MLVASVVTRGILPDDEAAAAATKQRLATQLFVVLEAEAARAEAESELEERDAEEQEYAAELARCV